VCLLRTRGLWTTRCAECVGHVYRVQKAAAATARGAAALSAAAMRQLWLRGLGYAAACMLMLSCRWLRVQVGTMIEVPRGALRAGDLAKTAEFFSFGTNDLTQM